MDKQLDSILDISGLNDDEKARFKITFYRLLISRILNEVSSIDNKAAQKLDSALIFENGSYNSEEITQTLEEISKNSVIKQKIERTTEELLAELIDKISQSATEEQKQQILTSLSN